MSEGEIGTKSGEGFASPAYERIANDIRKRVANGELPPAHMLPGRRALASQYGVSIPTVERAVATLVAEGVLRTDSTRGTFVDKGPTGSPPSVPDGVVTFGIMAPLNVPATFEDTVRNGSFAIVGALERAISRTGHRSSFINLWHQPINGIDRIRAADGYEELAARGVSAVVAINALRQSDVAPMRRLATTGPVPLIVVNDEKVSPPMFAVHYDHADAAYQATQHMIDAGCNPIIFFSARTAHWVQARWQGVQEAVRDSGLSSDNVIEAIEYSAIESDEPIQDLMQGGHEHACEVLQQHQNLFKRGSVGVVCANDQMAWGFVKAAFEMGFEFERDYLLIGFDDLPESRDLGLSSMRPPLENLGVEAAMLAEQAIRGMPSARSICLHSELVARGSSRFSMAMRSR